MAADIAAGRRGEAPASVTFLSGDVHHSYVAEASVEGPGRVIQAVCSPIRNRLPRRIALLMGGIGSRAFAPVPRFLAKRAGVSDPPFDWRITHGPWYDNNLATLQTDGRGLSMKWEAGEEDGRGDRSGLKVVAEFSL